MSAWALIFFFPAKRVTTRILSDSITQALSRFGSHLRRGRHAGSQVGSQSLQTVSHLFTQTP